MTQDIREQTEKEVLYQYEKLKREVGLCQARIGQIADDLERLVSGLRTHPQLVTPTPLADAEDYKRGLNLLSNREEVISLCRELVDLEYRLELAGKRKAALGY
jgi:hypothetical protein